MELDLDRLLQRLIETQHGLFHRRQAADLGVTRAMLRHRCRIGRWEPLPAGVFRLAGSPRSDHQSAMAAVLGAGTPDGTRAGLSHDSGGALWQLPGFRLLPGHVTIGGLTGRSASIDRRLHRTTYLPDHHLTEVDGIPVLTPSRLLFQLAGSCSARRMASLVDTAWARRLVSGRSLHAMCEELSEHGRDGMAVMREVLEARPVGYVPPESNLEARVEQIIRDHDLPAMRRQVEVGGREWLGRVDFVGIDVPLVVFVDGERWHSSVLDKAADARQKVALEAEGFVVVRIPEFEVWHDVASVVRRVREGWILARRLAS